METNTLLVLILIVLTCGFAVVSYHLTKVARTVILATAAAGEVLHRDVGHLEGKETELFGEIEGMIRSLTKNIHTVLVSTGDIESAVREALREAARELIQAVARIEGNHVVEHLVELAKSIERDLADLAAIPGDLRSMIQTLEIIADNTSAR